MTPVEARRARAQERARAMEKLTKDLRAKEIDSTCRITCSYKFRPDVMRFYLSWSGQGCHDLWQVSGKTLEVDGREVRSHLSGGHQDSQQTLADILADHVLREYGRMVVAVRFGGEGGSVEYNPKRFQEMCNR